MEVAGIEPAILGWQAQIPQTCHPHIRYFSGHSNYTIKPTELQIKHQT